MILTILLIAPALIIALPALVDLGAAILSLFVRQRPSLRQPGRAAQNILFLVPAHDEELLIRRCIESLRAQTYPLDRLHICVIADNCTDGTAAAAREGGATVLERHSTPDDNARGKGHAIAWALDRLPLEDHDCVVIVDADTIVEPDYATRIDHLDGISGRAAQTFDGMSNEFENWLTRMAGLLTRNRYDIALPLKVRARLNVPLTGDGTILGTALLRSHGWNIETITEGWELYARYTLAGIPITYIHDARLYAQETRSLEQSGTQRERWTAGRLAVFRLYWRRILFTPRVRLLARLDLVAELTNVGPIMRAFLGVSGTGAILLLDPMGSAGISLLFLTAVIHPAVFSMLSLSRHPQPWATVAAFLRLPWYAGWRVIIGLKAFITSGTRRWVRTGRHTEGAQ